VGLRSSLDSLFGWSKPVEPQLDALFRLPSAVITLQSSLGLVTNGRAAVCYKATAGANALESDEELQTLLSVGDTEGRISFTVDELGYNWIVINDDDIGDLVARVHGAHTTLKENGLGPHLLCSVFGFRPEPPPGEGAVQLVYLAKSGTFYPFAGRDDRKRDNEFEIRVRNFLNDELPCENDLSRWMALWGNPV
jgi:hypothetical protein